MWPEIPEKALKHILFVSLLLFVPSIATATCHVVTPAGSGSKTGADWNNAYAGLPATLVRGDSYYLADATNAPGYTFNTPDNGTMTVTIKKATAAAHCTDAGWNLATMGSASYSMATGATFQISTDYLIIDGSTRSSISSGYGIQIHIANCTGDTTCFGVHFKSGAYNIVQYVDIGGSYTSSANAAPWEELVRCINTNGNPTNNEVRFSYIHDSGRTSVLTNSCPNFSLHDNYITRNANHAVTNGHGQPFEDQGSSGVAIYNNIFEDPQGTGFIVGLQRSGNWTMSNWVIYNNVFYFRNRNPNSAWVSPVAVACINTGITCNHWTVVQNTFVNISTANSQDIGVPAAYGATGTGWVIENNLWYTPGTPVNFSGTGGGGVEDYNSCISSGCTANFNSAGAHDVKDNAGPNPFTNWTGGPPGIFTLANENADWTGGVMLSSPYNVDPIGVVRGVGGSWDRGAYQYGPTAQRPNPPQNLVVTSVQ